MSSDGGLRPIFRNKLPHIFWTTVETGSTQLGVPDSHGIYKAVPFWIEFKWTEANAISFKPEQIGWLLRYHRSGGRCFVGIRQLCDAGPRRPARDNLYIFAGTMAPMLQNYGLSNLKPLGSWMGGPANWDWTKASIILTRARG